MFLLCQVWLIKHLTSLFITIIFSKLSTLMVKIELCTLISRETCGILWVVVGVIFLRGSKKVIKKLVFCPSMDCEEWFKFDINSCVDKKYVRLNDPMLPELESTINWRGKRVKIFNRIGKNFRKIGKYKKLNIYTYSELKRTFFLNIQRIHVHNTYTTRY